MGIPSERGTEAEEGYERLYQAILRGEFQPNERLIEMERIDYEFAQEVRTAVASAEKTPNSRMLTPLVLEIIAEKL